MPTLETLLIFIPIALALNLTPGADMLFCLGQGVKSGPRAGVAASLGIATGAFFHSLAGGLGLAALIAANPVLFEVVRWAGVGYLVCLAVQALRHPVGALRGAEVAASSGVKAWRDGTVVCLLNPKVAIFMLALVPQFVDPAGPVLLQFLIFGAILNIGGTVINAGIGVFAGRIGSALAGNPRIARGVQILSSLVFFGLAARLVFEKR